MRLPLVDGQGNFGSLDGDMAAAMRYTEVRLARAAEAMLADIDRDTVDFQENYDGSGPGTHRPARANPESPRERCRGHRGWHGDPHPAPQSR